MVLKVGKQEGQINYKKVITDEDGWAKTTKFLPEDYDLVLTKIEKSSRVYPGWCIGDKWDGANIKPSDKVILWKRELNYMDHK